MPRKAKGLTAAKVQKARPGRYGDGDGLYLLVRSREARFWVFRYVRQGRMREMGLGRAGGPGAIPLVEARDKARELHKAHREGRDPIEERTSKRAQDQAEKAKSITFTKCADEYIEDHRAGWRNDKHIKQWESTIATYAKPVLGSQPVSAIDTALVLETLKPIWKSKTETASRLRGRIEQILDWATARGYRKGENPARWRGHMATLLPPRSKVKRTMHHAAMAYAEIGGFMAKLKAEEGVAPRALQFLILTAARSGEVIGARWSEFNLNEKIWTVPGERMKAGKDHRVALSARAIEILHELEPHKHEPKDYVFEGRAAGCPLSSMAFLMLMRRMVREDVTVHGFRSTFRDWGAERTNYPNEVLEMALAHTVGDKVEAAYRRGDLLRKRHQLAGEWATFCAKPILKKANNVSPIRAKAKS